MSLDTGLPTASYLQFQRQGKIRRALLNPAAPAVTAPLQKALEVKPRFYPKVTAQVRRRDNRVVGATCELAIGRYFRVGYIASDLTLGGLVRDIRVVLLGREWLTGCGADALVPGRRSRRSLPRTSSPSWPRTSG
jgi:hypothetical protein